MTVLADSTFVFTADRSSAMQMIVGSFQGPTNYTPAAGILVEPAPYGWTKVRAVLGTLYNRLEPGNACAVAFDPESSRAFLVPLKTDPSPRADGTVDLSNYHGSLVVVGC